jgi:hypothetical protein
MDKPWVAVDFDRTLATYDHYDGPNRFGAPIPLMVDRVKKWLAEGKEVRIMTARMSGVSHDKDEIRKARVAIETWCEIHIGQKLPVTCEKDYNMELLYDDRAVGVVPNTGELVTERLASLLERLYGLVINETEANQFANGVVSEDGQDEGMVSTEMLLEDVRDALTAFSGRLFRVKD